MRLWKKRAHGIKNNSLHW